MTASFQTSPDEHSRRGRAGRWNRGGRRPDALTAAMARATSWPWRWGEMVGKAGARRERLGAEPDVTQYCPSCGERGQWQKCKLLCTNPKCSVQIILACID
jgi:hypothetical protein